MDWTRRHVIGHGSSATVYLAAASPAGDLFAVKSAEISRSQSLQREQKILSSLASPYVVSYKGFEIRKEQNGVVNFNLFMEYFPNGSLADVVRRRGRRPDEAAIGIYTRQLLHGLNYIHSKGLVHCDVKSRNVLINGDGQAKLADFGCSKWASEPDPIGGTPLFMAPEVARGEHQGPPSDIWSIGCTVMEMATAGGSPWPESDGDPISTLYRIGYSGETPEIPSGLSQKTEDFLKKCLKRNPDERWTANQLLKHPFICELNSITIPKEIESVHSDSDSDSPTSVLKQGIWSSITESGTLRSDLSAAEQIQRLAVGSGEPGWKIEENWVTIRREEIGKGEEVEDCSDDCWGEKERESGGREWLEMELIDGNVSFCRNRKINCVVHNHVNKLCFHTCKPQFVTLMPSII